MERREFLALLGMAAAAMPSSAGATPALAPDSIAGRLIGTWALTSSVNTRKDGSTFERWGANPRGIFIFDHGGNYAQIIIGSESRVFGVKSFCAFGTYSVEEPKKLLITRITSCSTTKLSGTVQSRDVVILTAKEFKYSNPGSMSGATAEVLWTRVT